MLLVVLFCTATLFGSCEKEEFMTNKTELVKQDEYALKSAKIKRTFEGKCTFVAPVPNTWYDAMDDWRVTGTSVWDQPDPNVFEGTAVLYVDAKNPHDKNRGKWEMTWSGTITPTAEGLKLTAQVEGVGVEGKVKGLKANWTYIMNYVGPDFPNPENQTFFYNVTGAIDKPQGPIKK